MSEAWGLGRLRPVTLRPAEAWVGEHRVTERETRVTEREMHFYYFNHRPNKIIFFLALMNSAHLFIDVHCSSGVKKKRFSSTAGASF